MTVLGSHQRHRALLDTGSSVNLINKSVLDKFPHRSLMDYEINLQGVNGSAEAKSSWFMVWVEFPNGKRIPVPCLLGAPEGMDFLFGMPFLYEVNGIINCRTRIFYSDVGDYAWDDITSVKTVQLPMGCYPNECELTETQLDQLNDVLKSAILSEKGIERVRKIFERHKNVWIKNGVGMAKGVNHEFMLVDSRPICLPPRHIPQKYHEVIDGEIEKMINDKVISPSTSPWCTYPVLTPKPDGTIRFAIDYRRLNSVTVPDKTPLPRIEDLIASVEGSKYFGLLDLRGVFWHIPIRDDQRHFTAFRTHRDLYEFNVMPFGLINAPGTFQRWTNDLFRKRRYSGVLVYLDDILLHAATEEEFLDLLEEVMTILEEYGACAKINKCNINPKKLDWLGHTFTEGTRLPRSQKVEALNHIIDPTDVGGVRSILGMFGYYRIYIPDFAQLAIPLTRLLRKGSTFIWEEEHRQAVKTLAKLLGESVLRVSPTGHQFRLETDASNTALGAVLYDKDEYEKSDNPLPIQFMSKTLSPAEQNWDTAEREAYAIIWALETCDQFVRGRCVDIVTDHKNLLFMTTKRTGKISRWISRLSEYHINIIFREGKSNIVADCLSRQIEDAHLWKDTMSYPVEARIATRKMSKRAASKPPEELTIHRFNSDEEEPPDEDHGFQIPSVPPSITYRQFPHVQVPVETYESFEMVPDASFKNWLFPDFEEPTTNEILKAQIDEVELPLKKGFNYQGESITYLNGIWVPPSKQLALLESIHLCPPLWHPSVLKMIQTIKRLYNWPGLHTDVQRYYQNCLTCQRLHPGMSLKKFPPRSHPIDAPFQTIYVDFWGEAAWAGERFTLLTIVDFATKWAEAIPIPDKLSSTVSNALLFHWISRFGAPRRLVCDGDTPFISSAVQRLISMLGTKGLTITIYHPEGNAPVETFHRSLKKSLSKLRSAVEEKITFMEAVSWAMIGYRSLPHGSTFETPAFLTHGADLRLRSPFTGCTFNYRFYDADEARLDILNSLRNELRRRYEILSSKLKEEDPDSIPPLQVNELVLLELAQNQHRLLSVLTKGKKLTPKWSLPMRVLLTNKDGSVATIQCLTTNYTTQAHINRLRRIEYPSAPGLRSQWSQTCDAESMLFSNLGSRYYDSATKKIVRFTAKRQKRGTGTDKFPSFTRSLTPNEPNNSEELSIIVESDKKKKTKKTVIDKKNRPP